MWVYKIMRKDTRSQVPNFKIFLRQNHDLMKFWYEEESEQVEDRIIFLLRAIRFMCYLMLLYILVNLIISP